MPDTLMPTWSLPVTDFAQPSPRLGSIDFYSGLGNISLRAQAAHQAIQHENSRQHADYSAEVIIEQVIPLGSNYLKLNGKLDGLWQSTSPRIEEIKTTLDAPALLKALENNQFCHPYWLQLQTYGYLYWLKDNTMPELNLLVVCLRTGKQWPLTLEWNFKQFKQWFDRRIDELMKEVEAFKWHAQRRKTTAVELRFPFAKMRTAQQELITLIKRDIKQKKPALIQAPTGMGKTLAVLFPTLKESMKRGQRTLYVVPKNSQQVIAADAVSQLQGSNLLINSIVLTAKTKLCLNTEVICHSKHCRFANNHYTKVVSNQLIEKANKQAVLNKAYFTAQGYEYEVCPYALQMDSLTTRDVVIADYNYVFSPGIAADTLVGSHFSQRSKANLIIDEAHNLYSRSLEMYSAQLSTKQLMALLPHPKLPKHFITLFEQAIDECCKLIQNAAPEKQLSVSPITIQAALFSQQEERLNNLLTEFLSSEQPLEYSEAWFKLVRMWSDFIRKLEYISELPAVFFTVFESLDKSIRIVCTDAALFLARQYMPFKQIVAFSATLKPFDYYQHFLGLPADSSRHELTSPFCPKQRKILIIPQLSTKYSDRTREYPRMIDAVERIIALKHGNYLLFFPSFAFLEAVLALFPESNYILLKQHSNMTRENAQELFDRLHHPMQHHLLFAVQGGIFSEGLDYNGSLAIGAFIFGPPIPHMDGIQKLIQQFYSNNYPEGHAYATIYPAMAKSIQAAGRVIRTEEDKGIIILFDNRFLLPTYQQCMPGDWYESDARECVSKAILSDIQQFWEN